MSDKSRALTYGRARRGVSKAVYVYEDLRALIIGLELKPGSRIDKTEICGRLGVSRQPLSEAVARLADELLIEVEPQKGTFVARIRLASVIESAFIRRALESATVAAIAETIDDEILKQLERNLAYQQAAVRAGDDEEFYKLDVRFHTLLFEGLSMSRVFDMVDLSRAQLERARRLMLPTPGRNQTTIKEHRAIYTALVARNSRAATDAMGAHLDAVMAELHKYAGKHPELFEGSSAARQRLPERAASRANDKAPAALADAKVSKVQPRAAWRRSPSSGR